jgi:hypothetical protein
MKANSRTQTPAVKNNQSKSKTAPATPPAGKNRSAVVVEVSSDSDMDAAVARKLTRPEVGAAAVIEAWSKGGHDVNALVSELAVQLEAVNSGDMTRAEGLLISQAHTLDAIFVNLMRRATNQTALHLWEAYMRMGMKAQAQSRATIQALVELKYPRQVVFAKQANMTSGPQQVNNGVSTAPTEERAAGARAHGEAEIQQSKLLEDQRSGGTYLDTGAASEAARGNRKMATVGAVNRPANARRQGAGRP